MRIEIWSDVLCPFCYIGKRHLELALAGSTHGVDTEIAWKSFQLDPAAPRVPQMTNAERLARKYGRDLAWANQMQREVAARAARVGIHFDLDRAVPTNSFDAHRLIHLAAASGLQDSAEERLFAAHFTEGGTSAITTSCTPSATRSASTITRSANCSPATGSLKTCARRRPKRERSAFAACPFLFDRQHAIAGLSRSRSFSRRCASRRHPSNPADKKLLGARGSGLELNSSLAHSKIARCPIASPARWRFSSKPIS
jgi:hypothetical protein